MVTYKTIRDECKSELIEKKSKFICIITPIVDSESAQLALDRIKRTYRDASHHCFAYRLDEESRYERYSDDGEPTGTAGKPILELLRRRKLRYILVVVIRYFGGVKLGTGGLSRAYRKVTQETLLESQIVTKETYSILEINVSYELSGKVEYLIRMKNMIIKAILYEEEVSYVVYCKEDVLSTFIDNIIEETNNKCRFNIQKSIIGYVEEGLFKTGNYV